MVAGIAAEERCVNASERLESAENAGLNMLMSVKAII
jgi:hypothetical protein